MLLFVVLSFQGNLVSLAFLLYKKRGKLVFVIFGSNVYVFPIFFIFVCVLFFFCSHFFLFSSLVKGGEYLWKNSGTPPNFLKTVYFDFKKYNEAQN